MTLLGLSDGLILTPIGATPDGQPVYISKEWISALQALYLRVGEGNADSNLELATNIVVSMPPLAALDDFGPDVAVFAHSPVPPVPQADEALSQFDVAPSVTDFGALERSIVMGSSTMASLAALAQRTETAEMLGLLIL